MSGSTAGTTERAPGLGPTATDAPSRASRRVRVYRHKPGVSGPRYETFEVPPEAGATVLDALLWIRRHRDPSLMLRHSCLHASCGTCGMRIEGREGLACVTYLEELGSGEITVEPLANFAVVGDLVVDMESSYLRLRAVGRPLLRASELCPGSQPAEGIEELTRFEDCIECGLCLSACPIVATDPRYLGPAGLAAAWRRIAEPRGLPVGPIRSLVDDEQGVWRCHTAWECSEACPSNVDPAGSIMRLRRAVVFGREGGRTDDGQRTDDGERMAEREEVER
ncbi:MAG TPA: succinate dehydrogenase/fumarate reductase iron-sulfur subunit [Candidatus Binatia bacterium]|nr:succinate dehydrogenase/fumarate reductase iron-sulfur subunit [Candidatus Binatia bacterium]